MATELYSLSLRHCLKGSCEAEPKMGSWLLAKIGMAGRLVFDKGSAARLEVAVPIATLLIMVPVAGMVLHVLVPATMANLLAETMAWALLHPQPGTSGLTMSGHNLWLGLSEVGLYSDCIDIYELGLWRK